MKEERAIRGFVLETFWRHDFQGKSDGQTRGRRPGKRKRIGEPASLSRGSVIGSCRLATPSTLTLAAARPGFQHAGTGYSLARFTSARRLKRSRVLSHA